MREAVAWYEARDTGLGDRFLIEIERVFARIERQPHGFSSGYAGLRKALCRRFPDTVYFAFDESNWIVFGILPQRMQQTVLDERLE